MCPHVIVHLQVGRIAAEGDNLSATLKETIRDTAGQVTLQVRHASSSPTVPC